jgi:hypothetical protein
MNKLEHWNKQETIYNEKTDNFYEIQNELQSTKNLEELEIKYADIIKDYKKKEKLEKMSHYNDPCISNSAERKLRKIFYNEINIKEFLEKHGIPKETIHSIENFKKDRFKIPIKNSNNTINKLPSGYAIKGGLAKDILKLKLGLLKEVNPRDIDIIRLSNINDKTDLDDEISMKYMEDDYKHGNGIEVISENHYFNTRDFTQNEVYIHNEYAYLSKRALIDNIINLYYPTEYEIYKGYVNNPKIIAKIFRELASSILNDTYPPMKISGFIQNQLLKEKIEVQNNKLLNNPFLIKGFNNEMLKHPKFKEYFGGNKKVSNASLFLQLERSLEISQELALEYIKILKYFYIIPQELGLVDTIYYFKEKVTNLKLDNIENLLKKEK